MTEHRDESHKWGQILPIVLVVGLLLAIGLAGYAVDRGVDDKEAAEIFAKYYEDTAEAKNELCDDKANKDKPECVKDAPPPEAIDEGTPVEVGPSPAEVDAAVRDLLPVVLADQVDNYLTANPAKNGTNGATGPRGPGPTFDSVLQAARLLLPGIVADYLAANPPPPGKDGEPGQDAPKVTDVNCDVTASGPDPLTSEFAFTFTYIFSSGDSIVTECSTEGS